MLGLCELMRYRTAEHKELELICRAHCIGQVCVEAVSDLSPPGADNAAISVAELQVTSEKAPIALLCLHSYLRNLRNVEEEAARRMMLSPHVTVSSYVIEFPSDNEIMAGIATNVALQVGKR